MNITNLINHHRLKQKKNYFLLLLSQNLILVQPKNPLQFSVVQNEKQIYAICQTHSSKPSSLVYFLLNGQLIKQPLYKYLNIGDLITSRRSVDDPLVSSSISLRIPLTSLSSISKLLNTVEYRQFKIDSTRYHSIRSDQKTENAMKRELLNELTQLTNQQIEHQISLTNEADETIKINDDKYLSSRTSGKSGNYNYKDNRKRRNVMNKINLDKQIDLMNRMNEPDIPDNELNKMNQDRKAIEWNRIDQQISDVQTNNANSFENGFSDQLINNSTVLSVGNGNEKTINGIPKVPKVNRTINQVNGLVNLIRKNLALGVNNLDFFKNLSNLNKMINLSDLNRPVTLSDRFYRNNINAFFRNFSSSPSSSTTSTKERTIIDQIKSPIETSTIKFINYQLTMNSKTEIDQNYIISLLSKNSSPLKSSTSIDYKLSSISQSTSDSNLLPKFEALILDANGDKITIEENEQDKGLELSCISTIAQPIATTYDELNLEENSFLERKFENFDRQNDQLNLVDEFSVPLITNDELSISPGQLAIVNCTVNLIQNNRLQPNLKWFINDREVGFFGSKKI